MQDNWNSGIDPSFADKAWENMRKQLDEAMPVDEKQKRRPIGWWWAIGFALLLAGAGWFLSGSPSPQLDALPILTAEHKKAVAQLPEPMLSPDINLIEQAPGHIQEQATPKPEITRAIQKTIQQQFSAASSQATKVSPERQPAHPTNDSKANKAVLTPLVAPPPITEQNSALAVASNPPTNTPSASSAPRELIAGIAEIDGLAAKPLATLPLSFEKAITPNVKNAHWLLETGVSSRNLDQLDGFFAGIGHQWGIGHSKWLLGTGLYYRFQRLPFAAQHIVQANFSNPSSQELADQQGAPLFNVDPATNELSFKVSNGISIPLSQLSFVQKLHLVDIPLTATYKLGPKFHLHSTLQMSYLWKSFLDFDNSPSNERNLNQAFAGVDPSRYFNSVGWYSHSGKESIGQNPGDFQRWQLGAALGLTYYPSSHLGIRVQYRSSLGNVYQSLGLHAYDYSLGTSLTWRFTGR
ncbi:MAG: hypothetical protein R2828_26680 [Saprospiraceae bacterium]